MLRIIERQEILRMETKKYSKEELKGLFQTQRKNGNLNVSDEEYDHFCNAFYRYLPNDIVDTIIRDIFFIAQCKSPAFYISLESKDLINKKGMIFLSPAIFDRDKSPFNPYYPILHEIAHYILGHTDVASPEEKETFEAAAHELALSWII